jgi:hypothetical protein
VRRGFGIALGLAVSLAVLWQAFQVARPLALWQTSRGSGVLGVLWTLPLAALVFVVVCRLATGDSLSSKLLATPAIVGGIGLWLAMCAPESKFLLWPRVDTCFAPGFNSTRFGQVKPGFTTAQVEQLVGHPLLTRDGRVGYQLSSKSDTIWSYSGDHCGRFGDYAWQAFEIGFRDGNVVAVSKSWRYD